VSIGLGAVGGTHKFYSLAAREIKAVPVWELVRRAGSFGISAKFEVWLLVMSLKNHVWFWISTEFMKSTRKALELSVFAPHTRS
jgi:hypothetical protein